MINPPLKTYAKPHFAVLTYVSATIDFVLSLSFIHSDRC